MMKIEVGTHVQSREFPTLLGTVIEVATSPVTHLGVDYRVEWFDGSAVWVGANDVEVVAIRYTYRGTSKRYGTPIIVTHDAQSRREAWAKIWDLREVLDTERQVRVSRVLTDQEAEALRHEVDQKDALMQETFRNLTDALGGRGSIESIEWAPPKDDGDDLLV